MSPGRLAGKVILVTGAARGQGAAEVAAIAAEGGTPIATDVDAGGDVLALDVSRAADWARAAEVVRIEHGRLDGLVNNAGIAQRSTLLDIALEDWNRVLAVNLTGALLGIQALAPLMPEGASIVNVGSLAALTAHYTAAYTTSKWALRGLTRVASMELGERGVRVNVIHPGYIATELVAAAPPAFLQASIDAAPLARAGTVDDIAPLVVFLLSDESSYITGVEIPVDGGTSGHAGAKFLRDAARRGQA
jgi:3alpha(or 20beta)-hydroxysteroid dehydrogenase